MNRCLKCDISDTDSFTYKRGQPTINYPFDVNSNGSDISKQRQTRNGSSKDYRANSTSSVNVADRCRVGIGGNGSGIYIEGRGKSINYKPKTYK